MTARPASRASAATDRMLGGVGRLGHSPGGDPLRAARPAIAAAWCLALVVVALAVTHPLVLGVVGACVLAAGARCGAGSAQRRVLLVAIPMGLLVVVINGLVLRDGLTVLLRLGTVPGLGALDVTLEAIVAGAILALRLVVLLLIGALFVVAVDPDGLLRALRPRWPHAALTAALALRIVPVLARDGRRMADARRTRPPGSPGSTEDRGARLLVLRSVMGSTLDRAGDLAATLELRGHGLGIRARRARSPWSGPDRAIAGTAACLVAVAAVAEIGGIADVSITPRLGVPIDAAALTLTTAMAVLILGPLSLRRGVGRRPPPVARAVLAAPEAR
ncbi:MAG: energy-coupling factor transporter transmembrane component T [Solirubrobacteraceae bacterium]